MKSNYTSFLDLDTILRSHLEVMSMVTDVEVSAFSGCFLVFFFIIFVRTRVGQLNTNILGAKIPKTLKTCMQL